jgi:hypothetical protein
MAEFRYVHTAIWREDDWFEQLPADARLLWIYLFTNPSANVGGLYRITLHTIASESGLSLERTAELLSRFQSEGKIVFESSIMFVRRMCRYQAGAVPSKTVLVCIRHDLAEIPDGGPKRAWLEQYGCLIHKVSGLNDKASDLTDVKRRDRDETETRRDGDEAETETETRPAAAETPPPPAITIPVILEAAVLVPVASEPASAAAQLNQPEPRSAAAETASLPTSPKPISAAQPEPPEPRRVAADVAPVPMTLVASVPDMPPAPAAQSPPDGRYRDQFAYFSSTIGLIANAYQANEIILYLDQLADRDVLSWWDKAIQVACDNNARSWAYVRGILKACLSSGRPPGSPRPKETRHDTRRGFGLTSLKPLDEASNRLAGAELERTRAEYAVWSANRATAPPA